MDKTADSAEKDKKEEPKRFTIKSATDLQRIRLEKLMKNPAKEIVIPDRPHAKDGANNAPNFVRNVMGSSAGAGSGEFHVYRHLRRKEFARLRQIEEKGLQEKLDDKFQQRLDDNKRLAEEKTAKKRAKRLKKKKNAKKPKQEGKPDQEDDSASEEEDEDEGTTHVEDKEVENDKDNTVEPATS